MILSLLIYLHVSIVFCMDCREKKREKERDELWKRLGELEISKLSKKENSKKKGE